MRAVIQRVSRASVRGRRPRRGEIGPGLLVLLGVAVGDVDADADRLAGKVARLRIFENEDGRFDRSVLDTSSAVLAVSQFTLIADTTKGNRPSFAGAAEPDRRSCCTSASAPPCARSDSPSSRESSGRGCRSSL